MANKNFFKAIAAGSKISGLPFNEIRAHYGDSNAQLKGTGKLAQGVIKARERYRGTKTAKVAE